MEEYIEKNQLKEKLHSLFKYESFPIADIEQIIDWLPVIPKHGQWGEKHYCSNLTGYDYAVICSECEKPTYRQFAEPTPNYCPNCGAKMDGEEEKEADNE